MLHFSDYDATCCQCLWLASLDGTAPVVLSSGVQESLHQLLYLPRHCCQTEVFVSTVVTVSDASAVATSRLMCE
jgi:hypothetical protein